MIILSKPVQAAVRRRAEREGLRLHIASYGGSGTVLMSEFLNRQLKCITPGWHALLNHYAHPIHLGKIPRLVLMADPPTAAASVRRRGLLENVTRHLHGGQFGQEQAAGMVEFFNRWTVAKPLVFCKYEVLYDHLGDIADALTVNCDGFPMRRDRRTQLTDDADPRLLALRQRFDALPEFFVQ